MYFHLKVYRIKALSFVSVVFSSRQQNRKECLKFLRQDLKYLFEVKGENQFRYFFNVIMLNFFLYDVKQVFCYQRLGFFMQSFICLLSNGEWCFITFSTAGWKKTREHKDQEKNVLDLIPNLTNMAWITNCIKSILIQLKCLWFSSCNLTFHSIMSLPWIIWIMFI